MQEVLERRKAKLMSKGQHHVEGDLVCSEIVLGPDLEFTKGV